MPQKERAEGLEFVGQSAEPIASVRQLTHGSLALRYWHLADMPSPPELANREGINRTSARTRGRMSNDTGRLVMDWNRVEGNWKQMKGKVKEKWGNLTDDDLDKIAGRRDQLEGKIQERYGIAKDQARKDIDTWYDTQTW